MCLGLRNHKITTNYFELEVTTSGQCIFPFKDRNVTHNKCTMNGNDGLWCATSVNATLDWQTSGYCTDISICPIEGNSNEQQNKRFNPMFHNFSYYQACYYI